ncbi:MAG: 50S ribosomal protein L25 [Eubacteriales bacterium]|nr:50S ribosomal protein L25 [Eubacteriales bacterium]
MSKESLNIVIKERGTLTKGERKQLRKSGFLPASISSKGKEPLSVSIKKDLLTKAIAEHGRMSVFNLKLGTKVYTCMLKATQHAPVSKDWLDVTFQHIDLKEETKADVPINPIGKDDVIHRSLEFLQTKELLTVKGLPNDIPNSIDVEVSQMQAGDVINVGDIKLPEGISTDEDPDETVFTVSHQKEVVEEESAEGEEGEEAAAPEDDKKDEE